MKHFAGRQHRELIDTASSSKRGPEGAWSCSRMAWAPSWGTTWPWRWWTGRWSWAITWANRRRRISTSSAPLWGWMTESGTTSLLWGRSIVTIQANLCASQSYYSLKWHTPLFCIADLYIKIHLGYASGMR